MVLKYKTDKNQAEIVNVLRAIGATVIDLHMVGRGCPDLLVGFRGENHLFEIKNGWKGRLTPMQKELFKTWTGDKIKIIRNIGDAFKVLGVSGSDGIGND